MPSSASGVKSGPREGCLPPPCPHCPALHPSFTSRVLPVPLSPLCWPGPSAGTQFPEIHLPGHFVCPQSWGRSPEDSCRAPTSHLFLGCTPGPGHASVLPTRQKDPWDKTLPYSQLWTPEEQSPLYTGALHRTVLNTSRSWLKAQHSEN